MDADYAVLGNELIFYWLVHVKKRDVNAFKEVAQVFERAVLKAPVTGMLFFMQDGPFITEHSPVFQVLAGA